jgi:hypothetical protein
MNIPSDSIFIIRNFNGHNINIQLGDLTYTPHAGDVYGITIEYFYFPFPNALSGTPDNYDVVIQFQGSRGSVIGNTPSDTLLVFPASLNKNVGINGWSSDETGRLASATTNQQTVQVQVDLVDFNGVTTPYILQPGVDRPFIMSFRTYINERNNNNDNT